jgi:hypothetical protein
MKRKVTDLKPNEAILITNDAERNSILNLMDKAAWKWNDGSKPFDVLIRNRFPYCLAYKFEGTDGFSNRGIRVVDYDYEGNCVFYPATDFIGSEFNGEGLTVSEPDNTISIEPSETQIATFLRAQIYWYESNHDYQIATDTLRCWLDELEGKTEPTQLTRNTPTNEQR